jgi:hypothetical protein
MRGKTAESLLNAPTQAGQGCSVWAILTNGGKNGGRSIQGGTDDDDAEDDVSNDTIDGEQEVDETREEKKYCRVQECWNALHRRGQAEALNSFVQKSTDAG